MEECMSEAKRIHHFVPQMHLKMWKKPILYAYNKEKKIIEERNPKTVAKGKDFYKYPQLSKNDFTFIRLLFKNLKPPFNNITEEWIKIFEVSSKLLNYVESNLHGNKQVERELKIMRSNSIEDSLSIIEDSLKKAIDAIELENQVYLKDQDNEFDLYFGICLQYFRTKRIREASLNSFESALSDKENELRKDQLEFMKSLNFDAIWFVMIFILTSNMSITFYENNIKKSNLYIIDNLTKIPFIIGDQPAINLSASANYSGDDVVDKIDLYYPISPSKAIIITDNQISNYVKDLNHIEVNEIHEINRIVFKHALIEVFSNDSELLKSYK